MTPSTDPAQMLEYLFGEVEQAWDQGQGYERACQLANEAPDHAEDVFDFLEALIGCELGTTPNAAASDQSASRLANILDEKGDHMLADAVRRSVGLVPPEEVHTVPTFPATPPLPESIQESLENAPATATGASRPIARPIGLTRPKDRASMARATRYIVYAREHLPLNPRQIAEGHNLSMHFLDQVDRHPSDVPIRALEEIARRGEALGLNFSEALAALMAEPEGAVPVAASSPGPLHAPQPFSYETLVRQTFEKDADACDFWLAFLL